MSYGFIRSASAWHEAHSVGTFSGDTAAVGSDAFLTSWLPWQSLQMATRESLAMASRWPWTLDRYLASWSVGLWYCRIRSTSAWHSPQIPTVLGRSGLPMKPFAFDIATVTSSEVGSPPW